MSYQILTNIAASITDLKRNPVGTVAESEGDAVAILNRNKTKVSALIVFHLPFILMRIPLRTGETIMSIATTRCHSTKRNTNVYLTAALVEKARSMDMNLSATLDKLLAQAIDAKLSEREKEKVDMQAMNAFMTKAGMLSDDDFFGSL